MIRKQLYIDEELNDGLRVIAGQSGRSEAEHVRTALREYLDRHRHGDAAEDDPLLGLIGLVGDPDGPTDVAANHDEYLYGSARG